MNRDALHHTPAPHITHPLVDFAWRRVLRQLLIHGDLVHPRLQRTRELPHLTVEVETRYPVLTLPSRKLSYKFMVAEAHWILSGDDTVAGVAPWNSNITMYSDDGQRFAGAYGPRVAEQLPYVLRKLAEDTETRQAGLTIWRPSPAPSKDIPCTVAVWFQLRDQLLRCHVFMRSSDAWLGLPYDLFNFSMLTHLVVARLRALDPKRFGAVTPGTLYLTAASSHLYEKHWEPAEGVLKAELLGEAGTNYLTPDLLYQDEEVLLTRLRELRDSSPGDPRRWWEGHHA